MRTLRTAGLLAVLLGLAWVTRDAAWWTSLREALHGGRQQLKAQAATLSGPAAASSARKCLGPSGSIVYTDGECAPGSRAVPASGGTVNVLPPLAPTATAPASAASATPLLRQLADPAGTADLQEKRLQRATGS